jgi:hypothetical protein
LIEVLGFISAAPFPLVRESSHKKTALPGVPPPTGQQWTTNTGWPTRVNGTCSVNQSIFQWADCLFPWSLVNDAQGFQPTSGQSSAPRNAKLLGPLLDVMFALACLAASSGRFASTLDLLGDIQNGRVPQPAMTFCRVIAMSRFELLQEADQAHWPQISRQRLQAR